MRTCTLLCLLLLLVGCVPGPGGYHMDKDIDPDITREVDALNHTLLRYVASGNTRAILALCADSIKTDTLYKNISELIDQIKGFSRSSPYVIGHRFYARYPDKRHKISMLSSETSEHAFEIRYSVPARRSYTTIGYLQDSVRTIAITTVWARFNEKWKLFSFRVGVVKLFGKDAIDWHYMARQRYGDDDLADAYNCSEVCRELLTPAGDLMRYKLHNDMYSLRDQIQSTAERDMHFPTTVDAVKTKPLIFRMQPGFFREGIVPDISYVSHISLRDTGALSRECDTVNAHINDVFYKTDHYNKTFIYTVYNELPTSPDQIVTHYRFVKNTAAKWGY